MKSKPFSVFSYECSAPIQLTYSVLTDPTERISPVVSPCSTLQTESQLFLFFNLFFLAYFFFLDSLSSHSNISTPLLCRIPYKHDLQLNIVMMAWQSLLWRCRCWHLIAWFQTRSTWFPDMIPAQDNVLNSSERSYFSLIRSLETIKTWSRQRQLLPTLCYMCWEKLCRQMWHSTNIVMWGTEMKLSSPEVVGQQQAREKYWGKLKFGILIKGNRETIFLEGYPGVGIRKKDRQVKHFLYCTSTLLGKRIYFSFLSLSPPTVVPWLFYFSSSDCCLLALNPHCSPSRSTWADVSLVRGSAVLIWL